MTRPVKMLVGLTPQSVVTQDEANFLRGLGLGEGWLFEYVLAMYGVLEDLRTMPDGEDQMWAQFAADLGDALIAHEPDPSTREAQDQLEKNFSYLFNLMRKVLAQLRPFVDPISQGLPDRPVEVITFEPFIVPPKGRSVPSMSEPSYRASVLTFHLEDPNPNWLRSHEMWRNANDQAPDSGYSG